MLQAVKYKKLTEKLSEEHNVSQEILNSILIDVFFNFKERMTSFEDLRYSFRGLFIMYYRKTKLLKLKDLVNKLISGEIVLNPEKKSFFPFDRDPIELNKKIDYLLDRYEEYITEKNKIREHNVKSRKSRKDYVEKYKRLPTRKRKNDISGNDS